MTDGAGRSRRHGRFSRVTPQLKRLIIHATSGTISLDALSWLEATGAHVVQIDHDGRLVAVTATRRLDDSRLRRAQALALHSGVALELSRELIAAKIEGQARTLGTIPETEHIAQALRDSQPYIEGARTLDRVRYIEARAASAYWYAWQSVELRFPAKHLARIPAHWRSFGERHSPLTDSARKGVTPLNAILNYCYASRVARRFERAGAAGNLPSDSAPEAEVQHIRLPTILSSVRQRPKISSAVSSARDRRCRRCGAAFQKKTGVYCAACISTLPAMASEYAVTALRRRQREESGVGPSNETRALMGNARSQRAAAIRNWENAHPTIPSPHVFTSDILPNLATVSTQDVRAATGLCRSYCGRILRGQYVPHAMHWEAIRALQHPKKQHTGRRSESP